MSGMFSQPSTGSQFSMKDNLGRLVLLSVKGFEEKIPTSFGDTDAISADVVVLDGAGAPEEIDDALLFGRALVNSLKNNIGQQVLGRIGQAAAKPGQNPAWILVPFTPEDEKVAVAYVTAKAAGSLQQPQPSGPTAVPSPAADPIEAFLITKGINVGDLAAGTDLPTLAATLGYVPRAA